VSDGPGLPRLLATLLGVEVARPDSQVADRGSSARTGYGSGGSVPPLPTTGAQSVAAPSDVRAAVVRRPVAGVPSLGPRPPEGQPTRTVRRPGAPGSVSAAVPAATGPTVGVVLRRLLAAPAALRATVVATEVLGPPRAIRPYGAD
jgi:hypothetical protein